MTTRHTSVVIGKVRVKDCTKSHHYRLQNSPYFCVFKYVRVVKQKVWACEDRVLRACKTLTARFTDFFTDFEKKPTLLQSTPSWNYGIGLKIWVLAEFQKASPWSEAMFTTFHMRTKYISVSKASIPMLELKQRLGTTQTYDSFHFWQLYGSIV